MSIHLLDDDRDPLADESTTRALHDLEQRLARAWVDGDRAAIEGMLSADWRVTDLTGRLRSKTEVLDEMFASGDRPIAVMTIDDVQVRLIGTVAVITGRTHAVGSDGSKALLRFTDVAVYAGREWRFVASQGTLVQE